MRQYGPPMIRCSWDHEWCWEDTFLRMYNLEIINCIFTIIVLKHLYQNKSPDLSRGCVCVLGLHGSYTLWLSCSSELILLSSLWNTYKSRGKRVRVWKILTAHLCFYLLLTHAERQYGDLDREQCRIRLSNLAFPS